MNFSLVIGTQFVFCPPPQGKMDTRQSYDSSSGEPRRRVRQSPQKGHTCGYYAVQIMVGGERSGKNPPESESKERMRERIFSAHRKALTKVDKALFLRSAFARVFLKVHSVPLTRGRAQLFLSKYLETIAQPYREVVEHGLGLFCRQKTHDDFFSFAREESFREKMAIHEELFRELSFSFERLNDLALRWYGKRWDEMNNSGKEGHEANIVFLNLCLSRNLKKSSWHPQKPIGALVEQLQLHGPLLVKGFFGRQYYETPPVLVPEKIGGRNVFGWERDARRKDVHEAHVVIIVGAKIEGGNGCVYFVDPCDGSDPQDIAVQKVYVDPYERLRTLILDMYGRRCLPAKDGTSRIEDEQPGESNYAMYLSRE